MMNKLVVSNLAHRPVRSAISIVAIAIEVTLILLIVGFSLGMLNDSRSRQAGIGADVIVLPPGSSNLVAVTGAPMPVKIADVIAKQPLHSNLNRERAPAEHIRNRPSQL
jgi:putative ABC transport system permease protein